jgi:hypothetical protein
MILSGIWFFYFSGQGGKLLLTWSAGQSFANQNGLA